MLKKLLKEVVSIVVGKQAEDIIDTLDKDKYVNEFIIAKKLNITINQTRNILYKISDHGLIDSTRKKDKRKGWYTYFWKIEILKSLEFLKNLLLKKVEQLNNQIKSRETKDFYVCKTCSLEFNEENALLKNFTCLECGKVFTMKDNTKLVNDFKKEVVRLEKKLDFVNEEINIEKEKLDKKREREIKKEAKEKAKKRAVTAAKIRASKQKSAKEKAAKNIVVKRKPVKKKTKKTLKKKNNKPVLKKKILIKKMKKILIKKQTKKVKKKILKKKINISKKQSKSKKKSSTKKR